MKQSIANNPDPYFPVINKLFFMEEISTPGELRLFLAIETLPPDALITTEFLRKTIKGDRSIIADSVRLFMEYKWLVKICRGVFTPAGELKEYLTNPIN